MLGCFSNRAPQKRAGSYISTCGAAGQRVVQPHEPKHVLHCVGWRSVNLERPPRAMVKRRLIVVASHHIEESVQIHKKDLELLAPLKKVPMWGLALFALVYICGLGGVVVCLDAIDVRCSYCKRRTIHCGSCACCHGRLD
jgi:hypothetical protein